MRKIYLVLRSLFLWIVCGSFFFVVCSLLILLGIFIDPRKNDRPQRWLCRNLLRLARVGFEVRRSPGFGPRRTSFFIIHHVKKLGDWKSTRLNSSHGYHSYTVLFFEKKKY